MSDSPHFIKLPRTILVDEEVGSEERETKKAQVSIMAVSDVWFPFPGAGGLHIFIRVPSQPNTDRTNTSVRTQTPQQIDFLCNGKAIYL